MAELDPECHSGAVSFGQQFPPADWFSISQHLDTEESFEDYAKFRSSLMHIYTSLTMSIISENEVPFGWFSGEEQKLLERYRFDAYVQSSGRIRCDTNVSAILRGMVQGFSPPMTTQGTILHAYHRHLGELHYKHQFFACRKGLAKCDFIKCDSDFDEIFQRLKSEKKWPQLHESVIRIALDQHFSLLRMLNDDNLAMMGCVSVGNITEGDKLLEAINKEYAKELCDLTKSFQELRKIYYFKHLEFKILQHRLADQAVASRTACIPKECHFTSPKLIQVKDRALVAKNRILEKISGLKVRRVGRGFGGPSTSLVPGLVLFASIATLGIGKKKA